MPLITKITVEDESEKDIEMSFREGNYTSPHWIDFDIGDKCFTVEVEDIMDALIPFQAKLSRHLYKNEED